MVHAHIYSIMPEARATKKSNNETDWFTAISVWRTDGRNGPRSNRKEINKCENPDSNIANGKSLFQEIIRTHTAARVCPAFNFFFATFE